jgi:hypothetical protein
MSSGLDATQLWFIAGTVPLLLGGGAHALLTLVDTVRPTFFVPEERSLKPALEGTGFLFRRLVPGGDVARPSMWRAWLGFNISHGLGVFAFGLFALLVALDEPELLTRAGPITLAACAVSATYLVVALRFWFWLPVLIAGSSTACFAIAALTAGG